VPKGTRKLVFYGIFRADEIITSMVSAEGPQGYRCKEIATKKAIVLKQDSGKCIVHSMAQFTCPNK